MTMSDEPLLSDPEREVLKKAFTAYGYRATTGDLLAGLSTPELSRLARACALIRAAAAAERTRRLTPPKNLAEVPTTR